MFLLHQLFAPTGITTSSNNNVEKLSMIDKYSRDTTNSSPSNDCYNSDFQGYHRIGEKEMETQGKLICHKVHYSDWDTVILLNKLWIFENH